MPEVNKLKIIGRREYVDFPLLGITSIESKIDTGAYTSTLHCHDIYVKSINNMPTLFFKLLDPSHTKYNEQEQSTTAFTQKHIKSSSGEVEERFIIRTLIVLGGKKIRTSISLTDRASMRYPVLIGRKMIKNKFIINVNLIHTGGFDITKAFT